MIIGTVWFLSGNKAVSKTSVKRAVNSVTNTTPEKTTTQIFKPVRVKINKISIDAEIESVGMDEKGRMDVPSKDENVAWYNLGYTPGENGSAVLAGHFDTKNGSPAVFYNISKLQAGDTIDVIDANGNELAYVVTDSASYAFDEVPLQTIFATKGKAMLNLITCEGRYDQTSKNYSRRLVVYSELKN